MFKGQARNSVTIKPFCNVYNVTKIITYEITSSWLWYLLFDSMTCLSVEVCQMILFFSTFKILFLVFRYLDVLFTLWALHPLPSWLAAISTITGHVITWLIVFTGTTDIDTLVAKHPWSTFWKRIKLIRSWIINYSLITIGSRATLLAWSLISIISKPYKTFASNVEKLEIYLLWSQKGKFFQPGWQLSMHCPVTWWHFRSRQLLHGSWQLSP